MRTRPDSVDRISIAADLVDVERRPGARAAPSSRAGAPGRDVGGHAIGADDGQRVRPALSRSIRLSARGVPALQLDARAPRHVESRTLASSGTSATASSANDAVGRRARDRDGDRDGRDHQHDAAAASDRPPRAAAPLRALDGQRHDFVPHRGVRPAEVHAAFSLSRIDRLGPLRAHARQQADRRGELGDGTPALGAVGEVLLELAAARSTTARRRRRRRPTPRSARDRDSSRHSSLLKSESQRAQAVVQARLHGALGMSSSAAVCATLRPP